MNKKSFWVIIGVIVIVLIGIVYFTFPDKLDYLEPQVNTVPNNVMDTAGWKTYTNAEYGFEFKYPLGWDFEENPNANSDEAEIVSVAETYYGHVTVYLLRGPIEWVGNDGLTYQMGEEKLGGKNAVSKTGYVDGQLAQRHFIVEFDSTTVVISAVPFGNYDTYSEPEKWEKLDQILSTFKFTK